MVSVLAFYSDDLSLNPSDAYSLFCKFVFEKNENNSKKRPWLLPLVYRCSLDKRFSQCKLLLIEITVFALYEAISMAFPFVTSVNAFWEFFTSWGNFYRPATCQSV